MSEIFGNTYVLIKNIRHIVTLSSPNNYYKNYFGFSALNKNSLHFSKPEFKYSISVHWSGWGLKKTFLAALI